MNWIRELCIMANKRHIFLFIVLSIFSANTFASNNCRLSEPIRLEIVFGGAAKICIDASIGGKILIKIDPAEGSYVWKREPYKLTCKQIQELQKSIDNKDKYRYMTRGWVKDGYEFYLYIGGELINHMIERPDFTQPPPPELDARYPIFPDVNRIIEILTEKFIDYHFWQGA